MTEAAQQYYQFLYTAEPIDLQAIDQLLTSVPSNLLSPATQTLLLSSFTLDQITNSAKRAPQNSSPGSDGLPYSILYLLFNHPLIASLAVNSCLIPAVQPVISPIQTGFLPGKFIGNNGLTAQLIMDYARHHRLLGVGLIIDQQKAYDLVHPTYLCLVLLHVVLFNLAFDPLLRTILNDSQFHGFSISPSLGSFPTIAPRPIKALAYANDALFFLTHLNDFNWLQEFLSLYSQTSNAMVNYHKTEAISLSGVSQPEWQALLQSAGITAWHDYHSLSAIRYLRYPLASTNPQLNAFLDGLLVKLQTACDIHIQRGLSIQGRATVINTLIMSKIWHVLRVTPDPKHFHQRGLGLLDSSLQQ
ncbi:hypothetical protein INT45_007394 [Circinella minor]|uniref:Reverse transcriptase domain-containing protein n=1 Tax=Circinella minor TaxID=1195481 RepID=A0A8H7RSH5_9FUNG|nr:hypothetical protein INT45_007394 [Circinella minor]